MKKKVLNKMLAIAFAAVFVAPSVTSIGTQTANAASKNYVIRDYSQYAETANLMVGGYYAQQVWQENGITVTNDKAASTTNINPSYYNPMRCYQNSSLKIEKAGMTKLVFTCAQVSYAEYAPELVNSISGATATAEALLKYILQKKSFLLILILILLV